MSEDEEEKLAQAKECLFESVRFLLEEEALMDKLIKSGAIIVGDIFIFPGSLECCDVYAVDPIAKLVWEKEKDELLQDIYLEIEDLDTIECLIDSLAEFVQASNGSKKEQGIFLAKINPAKYSVKDHFSKS